MYFLSTGRDFSFIDIPTANVARPLYSGILASLGNSIPTFPEFDPPLVCMICYKNLKNLGSTVICRKHPYYCYYQQGFQAVGISTFPTFWPNSYFCPTFCFYSSK